jgi:mRNA interferase HicA
MPMNSKEMIRFLLKNGFIQINGGKGSHRRFKNFQTGKVTEVPCHSKELSKVLEKAILKQAGLDK